MSYLFKNIKDGTILQRVPAPTREALFVRSSLVTTHPDADLTKPIGSWLIVKVRQADGKWVETPEESEADRIWRLVVDASST